MECLDARHAQAVLSIRPNSPILATRGAWLGLGMVLTCSSVCCCRSVTVVRGHRLVRAGLQIYSRRSFSKGRETKPWYVSGPPRITTS
jgi:hypothetical protein